MTKKLILERLWKTIEMITNLKNTEFNFDRVVAESKKQSDGTLCGTICCVMGWYPQKLPKAGLTWQAVNNYHLANKVVSINQNTSDQQLMFYHDLNLDIILLLFYGRHLDLADYCTYKGLDQWNNIVDQWNKFVRFNRHIIRINSTHWSISPSRLQVRDMWMFIYYLIDNNYIENYTHG